MPLTEFHNPNSLGILYGKTTISDSAAGREWNFLGEAQGAIQIPDQCAIYLDCRLPLFEDLPESVALTMEILDLTNSRPGATELQGITRFTNLKVLRLMEVEIDDVVLEAICSLSHLHTLSMVQCRIVASRLGQFTSLHSLNEINLASCTWSHPILPNLARLPNLASVDICSTEVKFAEVRELESSLSLRNLDLYSTSLSEQQIDELKTIMPGCQIKWSKAPKAKKKPTTLPKTKADKYRPIALGAMNEEVFWHIISHLDWSCDGDDQAVIAPAVETLAKFQEKEICAFDDILSQKLYMLDGEIYARALDENSAYFGEGEAAPVDNVFSPDYFLYARACVVANGRKFFYDVIDNPANMPKGLDFEYLLYIAQSAWERRTRGYYEHTTRYDFETFSNEKLWTEL